MFSLAAIKALQIYGIAIAVSMLVAVLIKLLVVLTSQVKPAAKAAITAQKPVEPLAPKIPDEVVAVISAAVSVFCGPHRILHIGERKRSWASEGRIAQHSHQPRH
jgi:hypothetical protein